MFLHQGDSNNKMSSLTPTASKGKSFTIPPTKHTLILLPSGIDSSEDPAFTLSHGYIIIPVMANSTCLPTVSECMGGCWDTIVPYMSYI